MPRQLDTSKLSKFEPKPKKAKTQTPSARKPKITPPEAPTKPWPSREAPQEGHFTIRAPLETIERFRRICKEDRRKYADMLHILMDLYERDLKKK
jgi:hypothetical protein